jgi:hypothetical protein
MALVRCTCVVYVDLVGGNRELTVELTDPDCGYWPHRAVHDTPLPAG